MVELLDGGVLGKNSVRFRGARLLRAQMFASTSRSRHACVRLRVVLGLLEVVYFEVVQHI